MAVCMLLVATIAFDGWIEMTKIVISWFMIEQMKMNWSVKLVRGSGNRNSLFEPHHYFKFVWIFFSWPLLKLQ